MVRDAGLPTAAPLGASVLSPAAGEDPDSSAEEPERVRGDARPPGSEAATLADGERPQDSPAEDAGRWRGSAIKPQSYIAHGVPVDYVYGFLPDERRAELAAAVGGNGGHTPWNAEACAELFETETLRRIASPEGTAYDIVSSRLCNTLIV